MTDLSSHKADNVTDLAQRKDAPTIIFTAAQVEAIGGHDGVKAVCAIAVAEYDRLVALTKGV